MSRGIRRKEKVDHEIKRDNILHAPLLDAFTSGDRPAKSSV